MPRRILIADAHPTTRKGVKSILKTDKNLLVVGKAEDGEELYKSIESLYPELIILELELPKFDGVFSLKQLMEDYPQLKVAVFSHLSEEIYALSVLKEGVHAYIHKSVSTKDFKKAIRQVLNGDIWMSSKIYTMQLTQKNTGEEEVAFMNLSPRETEVLHLLSKGQRNKQIADTLNINEKTVSTYKKRLLQKLHVNNLAELLQKNRMFNKSRV